jgi:hypothetical protein
MSPLLTVASPKGPAEHQGNQGQRQLDGYGTPRMTQYIPITPGPPLLGHYAPTIHVRALPSSISYPCVNMQPF